MRTILKPSTRNTTEKLSSVKGHSVVSVRSIMPEGINVFVCGKEYYLPFKGYPWFRTASVVDVLDVSMFGEDAIRWNALDVDLEIECLEHPERYPIIMKRYPDEDLSRL